VILYHHRRIGIGPAGPANDIHEFARLRAVALQRAGTNLHEWPGLIDFNGFNNFNGLNETGSSIDSSP
jgi:hypothetical protein